MWKGGSPPHQPFQGLSPHGPIAAPKQVAAHDGGPNVLEVFLGDVVVGADLTALHAVPFTEGPHRQRPFMQLLAALAERVPDALVGSGDIAVE